MLFWDLLDTVSFTSVQAVTDASIGGVPQYL